MLNKTFAALAVVSVLSSAPAIGADVVDDPKARIGVGGGQFTVDIADVVEFKSTGWEIFGGFEFHRYFAFEGGYIDAGEDTISFGSASSTLSTTALTASVLGSLPIGDIFSLYGRAGLLHWESEVSARDRFSTFTDKTSGNDPFFGVGAAITLYPVLVRAEYRIAEIEDAEIEDDIDFSAVSVAIVWRF